MKPQHVARHFFRELVDAGYDADHFISEELDEEAISRHKGCTHSAACVINYEGKQKWCGMAIGPDIDEKVANRMAKDLVAAVRLHIGEPNV